MRQNMYCLKIDKQLCTNMRIVCQQSPMKLLGALQIGPDSVRVYMLTTSTETNLNGKSRIGTNLDRIRATGHYFRILMSIQILHQTGEQFPATVYRPA